MAPATLYENRPGGTIVRLADGTGKSVTYGQAYTGEIAPEALDPIVAEGLRSHADETPRQSAEDLSLAQAREAAERAAHDEGGQPGSSQSPIPGNYADLGEDAVALLVMNLAKYPEQQASVLYHEILFGGNRRKVIDAGSEYAVLAANARIAALTPAQQPGNPPLSAAAVGSAGDPGFPDATGQATQRPGYDARVAAALGVDALRDKAAATPDGPQAAAPVPSTDDNAKLLEALLQVQGQLSQRDDQLENLASQLNDLRSRQDTVDQERHSGEDDIDGGQPLGWDGKDGVNSEGYWSVDAIKEYAAQHEVDVTGASNRPALLAKLALAGHSEPQTPKAS